MEKRLFNFLLTGTLLIMLSACEYTFIEPTPPPPPPPVDDPISYSNDIQPIFNAKCNNCHTSIAPVLTAGQSYNALISGNFVVAGNPAASELYKSCKPGGSMASYTSAAHLELIYRWIYAGAKNN